MRVLYGSPVDNILSIFSTGRHTTPHYSQLSLGFVQTPHNIYDGLGFTVEVREHMKLVIDLPDPLVGQIKEVVNDENYDDAREFVTTAIENQLELEESTGDEVKTLDEAIQEFDDDAASSNDDTDEDADLVTDGLGRQEYTAVEMVPNPETSRLEDGPLWGQYNRIFPVKLVVRRLANVIQEQNTDGTASTDNGLQWIDLDQFQDETAQLARSYGLEIQEYDETKSRGRGEKLASGLPTGDDARKSKNRFIAHFIGHADSNQNLRGAPPNLHFVTISDESVPRIGITKPGLRFAERVNPLLDEGPAADDPLSQDEREFFLNHVQEQLPEEHEAIIATATAIANGHDRPDDLTARIAEFDEEWSQSQAKTMRSGMVSRMHELGLLERERVGQRGIAYALTETGDKLLDANELLNNQ